MHGSESEREVAQSCPTLCDLTDGSPSGSPVPGILQARTLEWVAISFSNAWKWKWKWSRSEVSNPQRPRVLQPTRLLCPWDFPGKSTRVGCHFLLQVTLLQNKPIRMSNCFRNVANRQAFLRKAILSLSHKEEQNCAICRDMDGLRDGQTEWSKSEREIPISYINTYMWNLEKWYRRTYLPSRNRDADTEN